MIWKLPMTFVFTFCVTFSTFKMVFSVSVRKLINLLITSTQFKFSRIVKVHRHSQASWKRYRRLILIYKTTIVHSFTIPTAIDKSVTLIFSSTICVKISGKRRIEFHNSNTTGNLLSTCQLASRLKATEKNSLKFTNQYQELIPPDTNQF